MRSRWILVLMALVLVVVQVVYAESDLGTGTEFPSSTYRDAQLGLSFEYPATWIPATAQIVDGAAQIYEIRIVAPADHYLALVIIAEPITADEGLAAFAANRMVRNGLLPAGTRSVGNQRVLLAESRLVRACYLRKGSLYYTLMIQEWGDSVMPDAAVALSRQAVDAFEQLLVSFRADLTARLPEVPSSGSERPLQVADGFRRPLDGGARVFGYAGHPTFWDYWSACWAVHIQQTYHQGEDWAASAGTEVKAVANGVVDWYDASYSNWPGRIVIIRHDLPSGGTIYSLYGHLGAVQVSPNQTVQKGQTIGTILYQIYSGGDNSHVHWEMRDLREGPYPCDGTRHEGRGYCYPQYPDQLGFHHPSDYVASHAGGGDGGGSCQSPSLQDPSDGYVHRATERLVTFRWSVPSGCSPDGYTLRVKTNTDMDSGGETVYDGGQGGTEAMISVDSRWDNRDLYWSVRACEPCTPYNPGSWAPVRRLRLEPGSGGDDGGGSGQTPTGSWSVRYDQGSTLWWDPSAHCTPRCTESFQGGEINKNWSGNAPCGGMNADDWVADFQGTLTFPSGQYYVAVEHDDALKVWLDGRNIIDRGGAGHDPACPNEGGFRLEGTHQVRVILREDGGDARVRVRFTTDASVCPQRDTTPPNGGFNSPEEGFIIRDGKVRLAGWASDAESGLMKAHFTAGWNGQWRQVGPDFTASPFEFEWDLCAEGVPDGEIVFGLDIWDNAGNEANSPGGNRHVTKSAGCEGTPGWLLMYYVANDNNLADGGRWLVRQLQHAAGKEGCNIAIMWDGDRDGDSRYYYIADNVTFEVRGEVNTGDPARLADFVRWSRQQFGGARQALIIDDHGNLGGVAWDDSTNDYLTLADLGQAFREIVNSGGKLDVLYMDVCLMGTLEGAYQARDVADYYVASESIGWGPLLPRYLEGLRAETDAATLARTMVYSYAGNLGGRYPYTVSVARLDQVSKLAQRTSDLAVLLRERLPGSATLLAQVARDVQRLDSNGPIGTINHNDEAADLYDLARLVREYGTDAAVDEAAKAIMDTINDEYILTESHGSHGDIQIDNTHGVSVFFPQRPRSFYVGSNLDFATGTVWGNHVDTYLTAEPAYEWGRLLVDYVALTNPSAADDPLPPELVAPLPYLPEIVWNENIEAETGRMTAPLGVGGSGACSSCRHVGNPVMRYEEPGAGSLELNLQVPTDGLYWIWIRGQGQDYTHNSWYAFVDEIGPTHHEITPPDGRWHWQRLSGSPFDLTAGSHTLRLNGREAGSGVDAVWVSNHPNGIPDEPAPCTTGGGVNIPLIVRQ